MILNGPFLAAGKCNDIFGTMSEPIATPTRSRRDANDACNDIFGCQAQAPEPKPKPATPVTEPAAEQPASEPAEATEASAAAEPSQPAPEPTEASTAAEPSQPAAEPTEPTQEPVAEQTAEQLAVTQRPAAEAAASSEVQGEQMAEPAKEETSTAGNEAENLSSEQPAEASKICTVFTAKSTIGPLRSWCKCGTRKDVHPEAGAEPLKDITSSASNANGGEAASEASKTHSGIRIVRPPGGASQITFG